MGGRGLTIRGYIKDYRKELKSDIWIMPPLYHRVWQYLKYMVNHDDNKIPMRDGSKLLIKKGQHLTSVRDIAKNIGWYEGVKWKEPNPKTVSVILEWLENQGMITIDRGKGNRQYTLISLMNWGRYQVKNDEGNSKVTDREHLVDINKNDKECLKNENIVVVEDGQQNSNVDFEGMPITQDAVPTFETGADSIQKKISKSDYETGIADKYLTLRQTFSLSPNDEIALKEIVNEKIPLTTALEGLDKAFQEYRPKHPRDNIKSLSYCVPIIFDLHYVKSTNLEGKSTKNHKSSNRKYVKQDKLPEWIENQLEAVPKENGSELSEEEKRKRMKELMQALER